jgi:predicted transcriptional regulator
MTKLLTEVLRKVAELPEERQDDAAHVLLAMLENDASPYLLTDDQLQEVERSIADADAGRFASDEEIAALLNRPWA